MALPVFIALVSVLAGALLGFGGRQRSTSALSTLALVSALAVVLAQILPDVLATAGLAALVVFGVGAVLPAALERLIAKRRDRVDRVGLELGYVGLLVHKIGDGVGLGTYGAGAHAEHGHYDVLVAIAAHTIPMVAIVTMAYHRRVGPTSALLRAFGLGAAAAIGVALPGLLPTALFAVVEPWIMAGVAGLLIHVVAHDWEPNRRLTVRGRLFDLLAMAGAIGLVLLGGHHHHGGEDVRHRMGDALVDLTLETAPALVIGLVLGAILATFGGRLSTTWLQRGGPTRQAIRGAIVGAPLPICACGVLPLASSLRKRGAGAALVVAFLLATPELGIETFALTVRFMGWPFAMVRLVAAVALAVIAALVIHRVAREESGHGLEGELIEGDEVSAPIGRRMLAGFDELVYQVAPWTAVGLIAAAYVQAVLPADVVGGLRPLGLDVVVVTLVAVPSYICAASATPLAAVLLLKGMSPGAVLVGLLLGPATNIATVGFLKKTYGGRATLIGLAAVVASAWVMAGVLNLVDLPLELAAGAAEEHSHGWVAMAAAVLLALAVLRSIWRTGLRTWIASLGEALGPHSHDHGHDHGHGHDHHGHDHHGHDHGGGPDHHAPEPEGCGCHPDVAAGPR